MVKETIEVRYYLSSLEVDVKRFARAVRGHWGIEIPQPEDPRSDNLCAVGRAGYHRRRRPVGVGRVERQQLSGSRRQLMLNSESICVPPAHASPPNPLTAIWTQLPPDRRRRLQRLLAELLARPLDTAAAAPREGSHDHRRVTHPRPRSSSRGISTGPPSSTSGSRRRSRSSSIRNPPPANMP